MRRSRRWIRSCKAPAHTSPKHSGLSAGAAVPAGGYVAGLTSASPCSGIYRRRADSTPYAMEGCTKRPMLVARRRAVGPAPAVHRRFGVAAALLTLKRWAESGKFALPGVLFGWQNFALTAAASVLLLTVVIGIAAFTTGRLSPAEELRQAKESPSAAERIKRYDPNREH